jgi:hypothetical protein
MYSKTTTDYAQRISTEYPPILHLTNRSEEEIPGRFVRIVQTLTGLAIPLMVNARKFSVEGKIY